MIRMLKKLIIPSIIVVLFAFVYLIIIPYIQRRNVKENVFKQFEKTLTNLNLNYTKKEVSVSEYGAWKGYEYRLVDADAIDPDADVNVDDDIYIGLYVFNKGSKGYETGKLSGYIESSKNPENKIFGLFYGHCGMFLAYGFPNQEDIINQYATICGEYEKQL